jgi:predicted nucleotidyltransferase
MDLSHPAEQLLGENVGRVLHRLSIMSDELTGRRLADLSGVPVSSAARVLADLEGIGLVVARSVGASRIYRLNRSHVLWSPIEAILTAPARIEQVAIDAVRRVVGERATLAAYGSFARGDSGPASDIDLLLVWNDGVTADEKTATVDALNAEVALATGNRVDLIALDQEDFTRLVSHDEPLAESWRREARTLTGIELNTRMTTAPT